MQISDSLEALIHPGALGFYESCEVTVCGMLNVQSKRVVNLFTIFSFESHARVSNQMEYLTKRNEFIDKQRKYSLVVAQMYISIDEAVRCCRQIESGSQEIEIGGQKLDIAAMSAVPLTFVPIDSTKTIPLNRLIKNNFQAGSMLIEWFGENDNIADVLMPEEIKKAKLRIQELLPIDLLTLSDRLGNILFQMRSEIATCILKVIRGNVLVCSIEFDERITDLKRYVLSIFTDFDSAMMGFGAARHDGRNCLQMEVPYTGGPYNITLMDVERHIPILQQTTSFIREFHFSVTLQGNRDAVRTIHHKDGKQSEVVIHTSSSNQTGKKHPDWEEAVKQRLYEERIKELAIRKEFIRYGGGNNDERTKALADLRSIMELTEITDVAYLWDPYLSAEELLDTWYYTTKYRAKLHAISSSSACGHKEDAGVREWIDKQRNILKNGSNQYGICLNWRIQHGRNGFKFHDRFFMIRRQNRPSSVWSLGISINGFGSKHHILQKVSNPEYIVEDFEELWRSLEDPSCEVWNNE